MNPHSVIASSPVAHESASQRLLAESFYERGKLHLLSRDLERGSKLFEEALRLDPDNAILFFKCGSSFLEYGALSAAAKNFKQAVYLDKTYFQAHLAWVSALYKLGSTTSQFHYYEKAQEKLEEAFLYLPNELPAKNLADIYWQKALIYKEIAEHSGEGIDYQICNDAFEKAAGCKSSLSSDYWISLGEHCMAFSDKVSDSQVLFKAIHAFKQALASAYQDPKTWALLAGAFYKLYEISHDEDHFTQSTEALHIATQIKGEDPEIWSHWASILIASGRQTGSIKKLKEGVEKCQRAYPYIENTVSLNTLLSEAFAAMGANTERLDLIYEAENKLSLAYEEDEAYPNLGMAHFHVLCAFAKYFQEIDYYYQAIEKLQEDLSSDRTLHKHWYYMGKTYFSIASLDGDQHAFEKSIKFFEKALELKSDNTYIFEYALALSKLGELTQTQSYLEHSISQFEKAISMQKNALYAHPEWLFHYARTLDCLGNFFDEEFYYTKALELFSQVLMVNSDFPDVHHQMAICQSHLADLTGTIEHSYKAIHHFRLASKYEEEDDQILLDWGIAIIGLSQQLHFTQEIELLMKDAETKILQAIKLGNLLGHYFLACLYALDEKCEKAFFFLEKAEKFQMIFSSEELLNDQWLDNLKDTQQFQQLLVRLESKLGA